MAQSSEMQSETPLDNNTAGEPAEPKNFFDLPAEIRNEIYGLALQGEIVHFPEPTSTNKKGRAHVPGVLMASKQIHIEALNLFYSKTRIHFEVPDKMLSVLRKLGKKKRALIPAILVDDTIDMKLDYRFPWPHSQPPGWEKMVKDSVCEHVTRFQRRLRDHGLHLEPACVTMRVTCWLDMARTKHVVLSCRQQSSGTVAEGLE